jgi:hypothetical protein
MMMRASASGIEDEETMGFAGGAVGSDTEAAGMSPGDPKINNKLSNNNNSKFLIARLLMVKVVNGRKHINLRQIHIRRQDFSFMENSVSPARDLIASSSRTDAHANTRK